MGNEQSQRYFTSLHDNDAVFQTVTLFDQRAIL